MDWGEFKLSIVEPFGLCSRQRETFRQSTCPRVGTPMTSIFEGSNTRLAAKVPKETRTPCKLLDDVIKNLKIKFCLCYSDCKTKQQRPPGFWSPSALDHAPIPHCPTGLSAANNKFSDYTFDVSTVFRTVN